MQHRRGIVPRLQRLSQRLVATMLGLGAWVAWGHARADGLVIAGGSPRAIGRAGVGTVSDDGGGALLLDPAVLARRDGTRVQLGVGFIDDAIQWGHASDSPLARDQSGSSTMPLVAVEGSWGGWILGAAAMTSAVSERELRSPGSIDAGHYGNMFEYRYTGLAGSVRRDTITVGGARRIGDWLAVGVSVAGSRVAVEERRAIWAGFVDRSDVIMDPDHDVDLGISAEAALAPSAVAGVLVAPPDTHLEFAASLGWEGTADTSGDVTAQPAGSGARAQLSSAQAKLDLAEPWTLRTGVRWLADRYIVEGNADLWIFPELAQAETWKLTGVSIVDQSGASIGLGSLPSRISERTHGALRMAVDVELVSGFLWATAGYAYTTAGTGRERRSTTFGELSGHTLGLGLEASAGQFTITLGWGRTWSTKRPEQTSLWTLDNPFPGGGNAQVPAGTYDASADFVGLQIDAELGSSQ